MLLSQELLYFISAFLLTASSALAAPLPMMVGAAPPYQSASLASIIRDDALGYFTNLGSSPPPFPSPTPYIQPTATSSSSTNAATSLASSIPPNARPASASSTPTPRPLVPSSSSLATVTDIELSTVTSTETLPVSFTTVLVTETVTQTITAAPTPTNSNSWSLPASFARTDLADKLAVSTWEWGSSNVAVIPGIPSTAWATRTPSASPTPTPSPAASTQLDQVAFPAPRVDLYNETVMQVFYPNGSINPANNDAPIGGTGMYMTPLDLSSATNVTLSYSVFFPVDFDFMKGGKLPGLYGGHTGCSGGKESEDCFSTRIMFRPKGLGELYLYVPKASQPPALCQTPPLSYCETTYGLSIGRGAWTFPTGAWTNIRQDIVLNTPGVADGAFQVFINGELKLKSDAVMFRRDLSTPDSTSATSASSTPSSSATPPASPSTGGGLLGGLLGGLGDNLDGSLDGMLGPGARQKRNFLPVGTARPISTPASLHSSSATPTSIPSTSSSMATSTWSPSSQVSSASPPPSPSPSPSSTASRFHFHTVSMITETATISPTSTVTQTSTQVVTSTLPAVTGPIASLLSTPEGIIGSILAPKPKAVKFVGVMFDTFFGGSDPSYASPKDQYSYFNRVALGDQLVGF